MSKPMELLRKAKINHQQERLELLKAIEIALKERRAQAFRDKDWQVVADQNRRLKLHAERIASAMHYYHKAKAS